MLTLVPGSMGGSETYARELTRELASSEAVEARAYVAGCAAGFSQGIPETVIPEIVGGACTRERLKTLAVARLRGHRIRAEMAPIDAMHVPFSVPLPAPARSVALIQTLLDVQHLELPQMFTRSELAYRSALYDRTARRADAVITISHAAKAQIVSRLGVPPERVFVAHLGVDTARFRPSRGPREEMVYYPARGWPHKNHARLVEAMELLRRERPGLRLVLTGGGLEALGPLPEWVDVRGLVSAQEVERLYATAGCLAFPSLFEGFGLPPLEAMASGCPVAASTAGSLPEVVGDAAVLFDPTDPVAIADGIARALDASPSRVDAGLVRARSFTWDACMRVHEDAYAAAVGSRRSSR
jgi:glycosyltransferase involved in cell wall biosynthesis